MAFVTLKDVYKRYHMGEVTINAADGMTFDIEKGEFAIIVGPSGSGKTTVLNMLGGMDTCDEGVISVDGARVDRFNRKQRTNYRRYDVGFIFQFYNLMPNLTAKENVELAAQTTKDFIPAAEILEKVGLGERLGNFPAQLSGGEQQRVSIARALSKKPKLLLCDEPTGALDYNTGKMILKLLQDTCRVDGMTVILVTHNSAIAPMADRVIKIKNSKVESMVRYGNPAAGGDVEWWRGGVGGGGGRKFVPGDRQDQEPVYVDIHYLRYRRGFLQRRKGYRQRYENLCGQLLRSA